MNLTPQVTVEPSVLPNCAGPDLQIGIRYKEVSYREACLSAILSINLTSESHMEPLSSPTVLTDL
jgi:hypothetical protein